MFNIVLPLCLAGGVLPGSFSPKALWPDWSELMSVFPTSSCFMFVHSLSAMQWFVIAHSNCPLLFSSYGYSIWWTEAHQWKCSKSYSPRGNSVVLWRDKVRVIWLQGFGADVRVLFTALSVAWTAQSLAGSSLPDLHGAACPPLIPTCICLWRASTTWGFEVTPTAPHPHPIHLPQQLLALCSAEVRVLAWGNDWHICCSLHGPKESETGN